MSFQNLRANNQVYVLEKQGKPVFERATVVSVTAPTPKYGQTPQFGQLPEMVVDIVVKIGDRQETYQKLSANADTADSGVKFITTSRDAMNAEVMSLRQSSENVLSSVEMHQSVIAECDTIMRELNPEYAERAERDKEIKDLREQMTVMTRSLSDLTTLIADMKTDRRTKKD